LDDKIELNRRMNRTLEAMARAIFKSWFVDFDPVRAKAAGQQPSGLAPHIAVLFPESFDDSDHGEIPRGWNIYHLPEIFEINPSRQLSKGKVASYLDMAGMPTQGHAPASWIKREFGSGMKFINGDTLVARITPCLENGKTAYVDFLKGGEVGWGSTEYIVLRPREPIPSVFGYLLARSNEFRTFAIQRMTGSSGRQRVPPDSLSHYRLAAPATDSSVFKAFGQIVNPLFERVQSAMEQSRMLSTIRDILLPRLISGELAIPDAGRIIGRCT
jgi:type I restriction enzyme S subunit